MITHTLFLGRYLQCLGVVEVVHDGGRGVLVVRALDAQGVVADAVVAVELALVGAVLALVVVVVELALVGAVQALVGIVVGAVVGSAVVVLARYKKKEIRLRMKYEIPSVLSFSECITSFSGSTFNM